MSSARQPGSASRRLEMTLDKDVGITMRDGAVLRANVFRHAAEGWFPVIMTLGPYGKDVHLSQFMPDAWEALKRRHPQILEASSCKYLAFETPDPECWVPDGYAVVKVDSRGAGKSPGRLDVNSPAEFQDFYDAIEWAGVQSWSNGKVGLLGISYYAAGQWMIASLRPAHLAAILPWQGASDFYRDRTRQGGIFCNGFANRWWNRSVLRDKHGNPDSPFTDLATGERNTGPDSLSPEQLGANRVDYVANILDHPLEDAWYRARSPQLKPGDIYPVEVEIWPASLALPAGYRLALTLQGKDFERLEATGEQRGSGWFLHTDPLDRPAASFAGTNTIHTGGDRESYLLLPVIRP